MYCGNQGPGLGALPAVGAVISLVGGLVGGRQEAWQKEGFASAYDYLAAKLTTGSEATRRQWWASVKSWHLQNLSDGKNPTATAVYNTFRQTFEPVNGTAPVSLQPGSLFPVSYGPTAGPGQPVTNPNTAAAPVGSPNPNQTGVSFAGLTGSPLLLLGLAGAALLVATGGGPRIRRRRR